MTKSPKSSFRNPLSSDRAAETVEMRASSLPGGIALGSWLICQSSHRWTDAVRRFAPSMMPDHCVASVQSVTMDRIGEVLPSWVRSAGPRVLVWEIQRSELVTAIDQIIRVAATVQSEVIGKRLANETGDAGGGQMGPVMQWAAATDLTATHRAALADWGISVFLRHPEDLPRYQSLVRAHFASLASHLD